jgi:hypothetical protein
MNGETRRALVPPPEGSSQMSWDDADHKVSLAARGTPTDNPGPDQNSPLDKLITPKGKKKKNR